MTSWALMEVEVDGVTYSAIKMDYSLRWRVVASCMVNDKLMRLNREFYTYNVEEELHGQEKNDDNMAGAALRLGYMTMRDEVEYHRNKALGIDPMKTYDDEMERRMREHDIEVKRNDLMRKEREEEERKQRAMERAMEQKQEEESKQTEQEELAGDLWGAF